MKIKFKIIFIGLFCLLLISAYFNYQFVNQNSNDEFIANKTLKCIELWDKKKDRLFGNEIGNDRVIYNSKLNTCLAGNIYYHQETNTGIGDKFQHYISVIDLITDKTLLGYYETDKIKDKDITWQEAIKKYEDFGLEI